MPKQTTLARIQAAWPTVYPSVPFHPPVHVGDLVGGTLVLYVRSVESGRRVESDRDRVLAAASKAAGRPIKFMTWEFCPLLSEQERRGELSRLNCPIGRTDVRRLLGTYHDVLAKLKRSSHPASVLLRLSERLANLAYRALDEERHGANPGSLKAAQQMADALIELVAASEAAQTKKLTKKVATQVAA